MVKVNHKICRWRGIDLRSVTVNVIKYEYVEHSYDTWCTSRVGVNGIWN